jgi:hypothetical protein
VGVIRSILRYCIIAILTDIINGNVMGISMDIDGYNTRFMEIDIRNRLDR